MRADFARGRCWLWPMALGAALAGPAWARKDLPQESSAGTAASSQTPEQLLQRMSRTIAATRAVTVKAERVADTVLLPGATLPERTRIEVSVLRPDRLKARLVSQDGARAFIADGERVVVLDESKNLYATAPVGGTIDTTSAQLDERFGFSLPLVEFVANDPYGAMKDQIRGASYRGRDQINGVTCDHLALQGEVADADLWLSADRGLPCRLVAVFKEPTRPQMTVTFTSWNLKPKLSASDFAFTPPAGAEPIPMMPSGRGDETPKPNAKAEAEAK